MVEAMDRIRRQPPPSCAWSVKVRHAMRFPILTEHDSEQSNARRPTRSSGPASRCGALSANALAEPFSKLTWNAMQQRALSRCLRSQQMTSASSASSHSSS
eukprot:3934537-Rhodomonas_salina.1